MPAATPLPSELRPGTPDLPSEFAHPPLTEAWLGVEFSTTTDFQQVDSATWRQQLGPEWLAKWQSIGCAERHTTGFMPTEKQLQNVMHDRAIRFAEHGFQFGWLGHDGSLYPRYEAIRDGFVSTLDTVREVLPQIGLASRWSVSYLNRIPQGTVWNSPKDWTFFRLWQINPLQKLKIETDGFAGCWQFPLEGDRGTLSVELTHETSGEQSLDVESLWLRLTACGPTQADESSLFDGLDLGREMIVRSFNELATADAKEFWGAAPRK